MNVQNAKSLEIEEGDVKTIHDKDGKLLWGAVGYDTKYAGDTFQQTYSGKNMYDETQLSLAGGFTRLSDGTIEKTLDTNGPWASYYDLSVDNPIGTYTISFDLRITNPSESSFQISNRGYIWNITSTALKDKDGNAVTAEYRTLNDSWKRFSFTITTNDSLQWRDNRALHIYRENKTGEPVLQIRNFQIEQGSTATTYEPYVGGTASPNPDYPQDVQTVTGEQTVTVSDGNGTSASYTVDLGATELCKIGTYQDYIYKSGDGWYVHKEIGKVTLDGTQSIAISNWRTSDTSVGWVYAYNEFNSATIAAGSVGAIVSDKLLAASFTSLFDKAQDYGVALYTNTDYGLAVRVKDTSLTTSAAINTYLGSNPMTVYYPLATPTDTKITDSTLIGELEDIHEWMTRYGYQASVTGNLPMIIRQDALT